MASASGAAPARGSSIDVSDEHRSDALMDDKERVLFRLCATPLSVARIAGTTDGAITGWAFTPAGFPIAILTGKVAADRAIKALRRHR